MISKKNRIILQKDLITDATCNKIRYMIYCKQNKQSLELSITLPKIRESLRHIHFIKDKIQLAFLHDETSS